MVTINNIYMQIYVILHVHACSCNVLKTRFMRVFWFHKRGVRQSCTWNFTQWFVTLLHIKTELHKLRRSAKPVFQLKRNDNRPVHVWVIVLATKASLCSTVSELRARRWETTGSLLLSVSNSQCKLRHRLNETLNRTHKQHQVIVSFAQRLMLVMTFFVSLALRLRVDACQWRRVRGVTRDVACRSPACADYQLTLAHMLCCACPPSLRAALFFVSLPCPHWLTVAW